MALTKQAILSLQIRGFAQAEQEAKALAAALDAAANKIKAQAATFRAINSALSGFARSTARGIGQVASQTSRATTQAGRFTLAMLQAAEAAQMAAQNTALLQQNAMGGFGFLGAQGLLGGRGGGGGRGGARKKQDMTWLYARRGRFVTSLISQMGSELIRDATGDSSNPYTRAAGHFFSSVGSGIALGMLAEGPWGAVAGGVMGAIEGGYGAYREISKSNQKAEEKAETKEEREEARERAKALRENNMELRRLTAAIAHEIRAGSGGRRGTERFAGGGESFPTPGLTR